MNFVRDCIASAPPGKLALIAIDCDGERSEWTFAEVAEAAGRAATTLLQQGVGKGDVVLTLIGNRPEWVFTLLGCFQIGAVALPCNEQLRAKDIKQRLAATTPRLIIADQRNRAELEGAQPDATVLLIGEDELLSPDAATSPVELDPEDPCLITFTSGTSGNPKGVLHAQRYLTGQHIQADNWLGVTAADTVWCTAASGWSKSARNAFIAPWVRQATALIHDGRFDAAQRLQIAANNDVSILCMAPTEYRTIAYRVDIPTLRTVRRLVAAGEALNPEAIGAWKQATGATIIDGYGQTETGHLTAPPLGEFAPPGSMGKPLPGIKMRIDEDTGELVLDPTSTPTFFLGYLEDSASGEDLSDRSPDTKPLDVRAVNSDRFAGEHAARRDRDPQPWHTGDRVTQDEQGFLYYQGRTDDLIISAGYRIGPTEVEAALLSHPAVAEAAVVGAPHPERGEVVRAVVVLHPDFNPSEHLITDLQTHTKQETAPYKYPRIVDFAAELPKTVTGKIRRAELRGQPASSERLPGTETCTSLTTSSMYSADF